MSSTRMIAATLALAGASLANAGNLYTMEVLGMPPNADSAIGVRMNNLGQVAGYSIYYGQGEPSIKPWVWTPEAGFTILPPPPDMFLGRARAMDINDDGVVAGDGGFDAGIAWRYDNGVYETFGRVDGMPIAYLGGINSAGDVAGTSKDAQITTPDKAFLDVRGVGMVNITPAGASRATDVNDGLQVCGYGGSFDAYRWDQASGMISLGTVGLAYSFAWGMNDLGDVVGGAQSSTGNTTAAWIYTDEFGQQVIPAPAGGKAAIAINNQRLVVGNTSPGSGPDFGWLWSAQAGTRTLFEVFDYVAAGFSGVVCRDINDAGQILAYGYSNSEQGFRAVLFTPLEITLGACCLGGQDCLVDVTDEDCVAAGGVYLGGGTDCDSCTPIGSCCLTNGNCFDFYTAAACGALAGAWQGTDSTCATIICEDGVPNDVCVDAVPIMLGDTVFSTLGSETDGPSLPASCQEPAGVFFGADIWFVHEPEATGTLTVSTCLQADYDTRLAAYTGPCADLLIAGCNDDACWPGKTSIMDVPVECGVPVLIRVGSFSVYSGTGTLTLTINGEPCCTPDIDGSGDVAFGDLLAVLSAWGPCVACPEDLDGDDSVGFGDLLTILSAWGPCH